MDRCPEERKGSNVDARMDDGQSDSTYEFGRSAQPVVAAAWRGRFSIPRQNLNINIAANVSNKACLEVASMMPKSLCLDIIQRIDLWPESFKSSPPNERSVALFFFPEGRDEELFHSLVTYAICGDYALKAMIGKVELLIFTSLQLPEKMHRFQGKPYLWGVFKGRVADTLQSGHHLHIQTPIVKLSLSANSCGQRSFDGIESPLAISSEHSPSTHTRKSDGRGRRLDDAWQHAKPLDVLRQKAECYYCGFISLHGGISRLKAHLGGGHPKIRLPGCEKVLPDVKKVMADWFTEWVKKTKALWTKDIRAETAARDESRRPREAAWEDQNTGSKCFSFDFSRNVISHHKVLGGGDPNSHIGAWSKASPELKRVKNSTVSGSPETKVAGSEREKILTSSRMKECQAGEQSDKRGRPLDNAWQHAKPLDEVRQKTQCNYCGFVSMYGGISRLKAHLGGGCPDMQLQGCPQVPLDVKRVMEQWFNEWVKYSTATWTRKSNSKPSEMHEKAPLAKSLKRARPLDDTWEHAIPLDETRNATKCKYCGFVSERGGIARISAHLGGGDITMQMEGCPYVPPDVRSSMMMTRETKKCRKKLKAANLEAGRRPSQETTATATTDSHRFERRNHILQETLNGVRNSCLKDSLQKLIHEENANMHLEIHSLQNQLASMP